MRRFVVFDRAGMPLFDLDGRVESCVRTEVLNGEHKLDLVTTQPLEEGMRILVRDGTLRWREWVVDEVDESHEGGRSTVGTYGCTWSIQYDLATEPGGELWPGTYEPITAGSALAMVLGEDSAWEVGDVTVGRLGGTSLYDGSRWDYLSELLDVWGGEIEPRIVVDGDGVTHRYVDWLAHVGAEVAQRRYDYGGDCDAIRRVGAPGPRYCRVEPRGGRDATDADGVRYSDRCGVEEEPYQADETGDFVHPEGATYIEDKAAALDFRVPDGEGGWRYPTKVVCYDLDFEGDQEELLAKAMADAPNHTRPKSTYEVSVRQYATAGEDAHGTQLGDEVHVVDTTFGEAPLRIEARVVEARTNELDESDVQLTIGEPRQTLASAFRSLRSAIDSTEERTRRIEGAGTLVYLQTLLEQLNEQINATGGYAYLTQGEGLIVYDIAVDDPLVGYNSKTRTWASQVVQIKGGNIRIANEKNADFAGIDDWKWKTLLVSGHIAAELVTAVNVVTGWLGNVSGTYIDLDNNTANFGPVDGYHFTVDVHGIRHWYGSTLLGHYLDSEMQIGKTAASHIVADTSGIELFDASAVSIAMFGANGMRLGKANETRLEADYHSLKLLDKEGNTYLHVSDLRDANGRAIVTETFIIPTGHSSTSDIEFMFMMEAIDRSYTVKKNGVTVTSGVSKYEDAIIVRYSSGITVGDRYTVTYVTDGIYAKAYTLGFRKADGAIGPISIVEGFDCVASGAYSHAEGHGSQALMHASHAEGGIYNPENGRFIAGSVASGVASHAEGSGTASGLASHAEGYMTTASGDYSHAEGYMTTASGDYSHACGDTNTASGECSATYGYKSTASAYSSFAFGVNLKATRSSQFVCGRYNITNRDALFIVGDGYDGRRKNIFQCVSYDGPDSPLAGIQMFSSSHGGIVYVNGSTVHTSDRRLKEHHAYLGDDAVDFVRKLKPALFTKDGKRHVGFYAQDVQAVEPEEWDTETVTAQRNDESLGFDPLTLDYNALIAPLVAYAQQLERRIDEQDRQIDELTERIEALEAGR